MTRSELVALIAKRKADLVADDVRMAVSVLIDSMSHALADGRRIELRGFGVFTITEQAPRTVRNPRTGERTQIAERHHARFKAGKDLHDRLQRPDEPDTHGRPPSP